jgi:hypothetical protein
VVLKQFDALPHHARIEATGHPLIPMQPQKAAAQSPDRLTTEKADPLITDRRRYLIRTIRVANIPNEHNNEISSQTHQKSLQITIMAPKAKWHIASTGSESEELTGLENKFKAFLPRIG